MMDISFVQGVEYRDLIKECILLDKNAYTKEFQGNLDIYYSIFDANYESFTFALSGTKLIGYIISTPLSKNGHSQICSGKHVDTCVLTNDDFIDFKEAEYIYIYSIVVHPLFRNKGVSKKLFSRALKQCYKWRELNSNLKTIFADTVNKKVFIMASRRGFKLKRTTLHNSAIVYKDISSDYAV